MPTKTLGTSYSETTNLSLTAESTHEYSLWTYRAAGRQIWSKIAEDAPIFLKFRQGDQNEFTRWSRKETQKRCSQLSKHYGPGAHRPHLDPVTYELKKAEVLKKKAISEMDRRDTERSTRLQTDPSCIREWMQIRYYTLVLLRKQYL